jgi:tRNA(His) guanylyltransferase
VPHFKDLSQKCKFYEKNFGLGSYLMPKVPALVRIDGRAFHSFCRGLRRPFDERLSQLIIDTTAYLVQECSCTWGFCQSDEISLCWYTDNDDSQIFFDGKTQKIVSQTASLATEFFNRNLSGRIPEKADKIALFDSRAWSVPTLEDAVGYAVWRQNDATKNSVSMLARSHFTDKELYGKRGEEMIGMLLKKNIDWNLCPNFFKYGTFIRRLKKQITLSPEEINNHNSRKNSPERSEGLTFERTVVECAQIEKLTQVENKTNFLFPNN